LMAKNDLYALYLVAGDDEEIAHLDLGRDDELGQVTGIAIYTSPDGKIQREHLAKFTPPAA
jgi:hypothetical protein